jgi:dienelactone hydrolase
MRTLLVSDIFGKTSSFKALAEAISENVEIIDPYAGAEISFADETEAYAYFMKNVGLERYCQIVNRHVTSISQPTEIIGFSVGASAIWILSEILSPLVFQRVVCFYGSQIRYHKNINPCVCVELVMPKLEPTFNVEKLSRELSNKPSVKIHRSQYMHGFMNHLSKNFSSIGYEKYIVWLKNQ